MNWRPDRGRGNLKAMHDRNSNLDPLADKSSGEHTADGASMTDRDTAAAGRSTLGPGHHIPLGATPRVVVSEP